MNEATSTTGNVTGFLPVRQKIVLWVGAAVTTLVMVASGLSGIALRNDNPALALAFWPVSAEALARRAEQLFAQRRPLIAQALAVRALRITPMNSVALRVIVRTAQQQDDTALAEAGLELAARSGWHDGFAQSWLLDRAIAEKSYSVAAQAADALLRIRFANADARAAITTLIETPGGRAALVERMAARPPWTGVVLRDLRAVTSKQAAMAAALIIMLDRRGIRPDDNEMRPVIDDAMANGQGAVMRQLWRKLSPNMIVDPEDGLSDGDFTQFGADAARWQPFGWNATESPDLQIETPSRTEFQVNPVLRIQAEGNRPIAAIGQLLTLRPGRYDLSFQYKMETGLRQAFIWQIQCVGQTSRLLYRPAIPASAGQDWSENQLQFDVPSKCPGQRIVLLVRPFSTGPSTASFDAVRITPFART